MNRFLILFFLLSQIVYADEATTRAYPVEPSTLFGLAPPYAPRKTDYAFESGLMSTKDEVFWAGAMMGKHIGTCVLSFSETCQQYIDAIIGMGVRESQTQGHFWLSPRWQYVNFPNRYSPFWRVGAGIASLASPDGRAVRGVSMAGIGVTTYLHDKVDIHIETRVVVIDKVYNQTLVGVNIKADRLLTYFAQKIRDLGVGAFKTAIDATGTAIEATGEGIGGIVKGVSSPFTGKEKPVPSPTPHPVK